MEEMGFNLMSNHLLNASFYDLGKPLFMLVLCSASGYEIIIGAFSDQCCTLLDLFKDVEDYVVNEDGTHSKLSHPLLKSVYADGSCVPFND
eukprot:scaffold738_cov124-Cylindrotheca_fusiformis.AAC.2